ncbi:hypothetical protein C8R45DRAFT_941188 [Mycena sanguinolenta]|nr:hypothetical protein C8R45DRAFT_941188 [Mycena sanguinolenta]
MQLVFQHDSHRACNRFSELTVLLWSGSSESWVAQANHIFARLHDQTSAHLEEYRNSMRWPSWLEPSGANPLAPEDGKTLGFPIIHLETIKRGYSWDSSVYTGVRQFHLGKGSDPDAQDVSITRCLSS